MTDLRTPPVNDGDLFSERARQYALEKPLQRIHVLEAGCGWGTGLDLGDHEHHVTGIDLDAPELRAHTRERADLDAWHLGDLRTVPLPPRAYDIVHAAYLIERVPHAELVLDRFVAALKPGGLLLVQLRDRDTAFGFLDRMLPRWLRMSGRDPRGTHARGVPHPAGGRAPGPPEPALYERVASRAGMHWYCVMRGLVVSQEYTSRRAIEALGAGSGPAELLCRLVSTVTRGRLTADHSDITLVIRKPENRFARII
ncbi:class I SAM-dependent methyltransferase [Actinomadura formosensis]|uniref:class I SAM-dependent methyltransferase n=1 Tax=Actinomadura formosensis TaxID=60706 RepID=UPI00082CC948|nr:class I SAM-dependent methyltransferase [Actinomadura formosensis]